MVGAPTVDEMEAALDAVNNGDRARQGSFRTTTGPTFNPVVRPSPKPKALSPQP
jgi:hypothetical protein